MLIYRENKALQCLGMTNSIQVIEPIASRRDSVEEFPLENAICNSHIVIKNRDIHFQLCILEYEMFNTFTSGHLSLLLQAEKCE